MGVYKNGRVEIIANDQGNRITPSYVAFTPEGERLIGDAAKNQLTTNPENTIFDAKRLIGRNWGDPTVQSDIKHFPFTTKNKNNKPHMEVKVKGEEKLFAAEEISAMVLIKMKVGLSRSSYVFLFPILNLNSCFSRKLLRPTLDTQSPTLLSRYLPTSMMPSARPPRMQAPLPGSTS